MVQNFCEDDEGPIIQSTFKTVPLPKLETSSACQYLLNRAEENAAGKNGKSQNWVTDSVTDFTLTFADIEPMSRKVASAMVKKGMVKGDVVLYLTTDVTKIYTTILGIWRLGGILYSSYPEDTWDTLATRIREANIKWVLCDPVSLPQVKEAAASVEWAVEIIVFGSEKEDGVTTRIDQLYEDDGQNCPQKIETDLDDPLLILSTSGTTGRSKGAVYTNRCLFAFCLGAAGVPRSDKPALLVLRCYHVLGCLYPIRNICMSIWAVLISQVNQLNIFKAVDKYKPNLAFGFPTYLQQLTSPEADPYDRSSLEVVCTGGIILTPQYYEVMKSLPCMKYVINGYGMSECGALTTTVDLNAEEFRAIPKVPDLSAGRLFPNTFMKVIDLDTGKPVGPNRRGELVFKSPIMATSYWKQPEETKTTFVNGWLKTGDVGYYDDDGFIFIVDRIKETFKYYGNHVSPAELEEVILKHPAVAEVCCFGMRDPAGGDHIPRAVVMLKSEAQASSEEILEFADSQVAAYKKIRGGLFIVPSLPRGKTGKVVRSMVANMDLSAN